MMYILGTIAIIGVIILQLFFHIKIDLGNIINTIMIGLFSLSGVLVGAKTLQNISGMKNGGNNGAK